MQSLSGCRWLRAIRNSLVLLLPVIFVGAMALLLGSFPFSVLLPSGVASTGTAWADLAMLVRDQKITYEVGLEWASDKQEFNQYFGR